MSAKSIFLSGLLLGAMQTSWASDAVLIAGGEYRSLFTSQQQASEIIKPFKLDRNPVTNSEYQLFLQHHPRWLPQNITSLFADQSYLQHFQKTKNGEISLNKEQFTAPVIYVSWFAAKAYCQAQGGRLPVTSEWEFALQQGSYDLQVDEQRILNWYAQTQPAEYTAVAQQPMDKFGLHDMHGLIWEWTSDFNNVMTTGESRGDSALDNQFYCGAAAVGSADPTQYATFMRYAFRSSLKANYTIGTLGFRCAYDVEDQ